MEFTFLIENKPVTVFLDKKDGLYYTQIDGKVIEVDIRTISPNVFSILIEGVSHRIYLTKDGEKYYSCCNGRHFVFLGSSGDDDDAFTGEEDRSLEDMLIVKAPMPGKIIQINVEKGQEVRKNQTLAIVEAMKMENEIKAGVEAVVKKILVETGDLVDPEKVLIELEALDNT
jgi:acetyl/propionyl-CoA carboxylase alpha subunit